VQFRVVGPDPKVLRLRADEVKAIMRTNPAARGVNDNWNENIKVVRFEVDEVKARSLGVTAQSIAQAMRTLLVGTTVEQFREDIKLIDIVLRQPLSERDAISDLNNAYVPTANGRMVPVTQLVKPVLTWEPGVMWREGREYAITVQCDITEGLQGALILGADKSGIFAKALQEMGTNAGATGKAYEVMSQNFEVATQRMVNAADVAMIKAGQPLLDEFGGVANGIAAIFQSLGKGIDSGAFDPIIQALEAFGVSASSTLKKLATAAPPMLNTAPTWALGNCMSPASPLSCMAAMTCCETPVAPIGWPRDFKPPEGLTGKAPSKRLMPS